MIKDIRLKLDRHKALISNFNFMSILQISQILFPLLIYPYLIRVLGKETYGLIAYSNAIVAYLLILINFGFNISEINDIAINRDNIQKISDIISSVFIIRTFLFTISILLLVITVIAIPALNNHKWLYFAYAGILINGAIDPSFYFQGIEKMKFITIITVSSNLLFLLLVIFFVKDKSHYILVPLFTSIGALLGSLIGVYLVFIAHKVRFRFQSIKQLKFRFKQSVPFFSSRLSAIIIDKSSIVLLGSFVGYQQVAYYDLAMKVVGGLKVPFQIFNQVLFPNISRTKNISLVVKILRNLIIFYILGYISLFFIGESVIKILGGSQLLPAKYVLYLLGITTVTELISTFMGAPMLLATGHKSEYNKSIIYGSIFYFIIVIIIWLGTWIGLYSLALVTVSTSIFIMLYRLYYCKTFKLI